LKHDYLAKFMPRGRFTTIRDALVEAEVISVRKFCVPGELCFGYRLLPPHDQGFSHYQPTTEPLIKKIMAWRAKEFREIRLPLHRDLRRFVKSLTIDEQAARRAVHGRPIERSAQIAMIQRIANNDFFTVVDRFGRFHSNLTNLKSTLRPFLRYRGIRLCNLDIANSQPMIFCLLLVNLLSNDDKLGNLIDYSFPDTKNDHYIEIDQEFLNSLSASAYQDYLEDANSWISSRNTQQDNQLQYVNSQQTVVVNQNSQQEDGGTNSSRTTCVHDSMRNSELQRANNRQTDSINRYTQQEEGEGAGTLLYYMQMKKKMTIRVCQMATCNELIIGKLFPLMPLSSSACVNRELSTTI